MYGAATPEAQSKKACTVSMAEIIRVSAELKRTAAQQNNSFERRHQRDKDSRRIGGLSTAAPYSTFRDYLSTE